MNTINKTLKSIILLFSFLFIYHSAVAESDLTKMNLKGPVKSVKETGQFGSYDITLFNDDGNIKSITSYNSDDKKDSEILFTYDPNLFKKKTVLDKKVTFMMESGKMKLQTQNTYDYDRSAKLLRITYKNFDFDSTSTIGFSYLLGQDLLPYELKSKEITFTDGKREFQKRYVYNSNNKLEKETHLSGNDDVYYVFTTKYNEKGHKESVTRTNGSGELLEAITFNDHLEVSNNTSYFPNSSEANTYEYDTYGNWIKRKSTYIPTSSSGEAGKPELSTQERFIEYKS